MPVLTNTKRHSYNIYLKGHQSKKYHFDNDLFCTISTESDAYWYGFFVADGFVKNKGTFGFDIGIADIDHLRKFSGYAKTNQPIAVRGRFCRLEISGRHILKRLEAMGLKQGKSESVGMPNLPVHLRHHFIRGVFDGDGWITYYKPQKSLSFGIVGNIGLMSGIQICLIEECGLSWTTLRKDNRKKDWLAILSYGGNVNCAKIFDYLYCDSSIYLERKFKKWTDHMRG